MAIVPDVDSYAKLKEHVAGLQAGWWSGVEDSQGDDTRTILTFEDASAKLCGEGTETWPAGTVVASAQETFDLAFQRFRVQANKRHRHPFRPALNFDIVYQSESASATPSRADEGQENATTRIPFSDASKYTVQQVVDLFGGIPTLSYVRDDSANPEHDKGPIAISPWDRQLPPSCSTPAHWIAPSIPPGFGQSSSEYRSTGIAYEWRSVSTLALPGLGSTILPTTTVPSLIPSHLILLASETSWGYVPVSLRAQGDYVEASDKRSPVGLTTREIRTSLLGRYVQISTRPLAATAEAAITDTKEPSIKSTHALLASDRLGMAWGFEPTTRMLYCVTPTNDEFVVDLSTATSDVDAKSESTTDTHASNPKIVRCEWIGPVSIAVDRETRSRRAEERWDYRGDERSYIGKADKDWVKAFWKRVKLLNDWPRKPLIVEITKSDCLVAGELDLMDLECWGLKSTIEDLAPGPWLVTCLNECEIIEEYMNDDSEDEDEEEIRHVSKPQKRDVVRAAMRNTDIGKDTLETATWEPVTSFTADYDHWMIYSLNELQRMALEATDLESALENVAELATEENTKFPGGVVVYQDHDARFQRFDVEGKKVNGSWAQLRIIGIDMKERED